MWVEFIVRSLLCSEKFFSGYSGFPLSSKTNISKFPFDPDFSGRIATLWKCHYKFLLLLLFLLLFHWRCSQMVRLLVFVWSDPTCHCRREIVREMSSVVWCTTGVSVLFFPFMLLSLICPTPMHTLTTLNKPFHSSHCHIGIVTPQTWYRGKPDSAVGKTEARCAIEQCIRDVRAWIVVDKSKINEEKTEFMLIGTRLQLSKVRTDSL